MTGGATGRRAPLVVLVAMAVALMATSPPPQAGITAETQATVKFAAGESVSLPLVVTLNEEAFDKPFLYDPSISISLDAYLTEPLDDGESEPLVEAELQAARPHGTVFGQPLQILRHGDVELLPFCGGEPSCKQHFRIMVDRRGSGPTMAAQLRVRASAQYEGDLGDEPAGASIAIEFGKPERLEAAPASQAGGATDDAAAGDPLVVELVDEGWRYTRPAHVSLTRIGRGHDPVLVRVPSAQSTVRLRGGDDPIRMEAGDPVQTLCGGGETWCADEFEIDFFIRPAQGSEARATIEFFSSEDWLVERGGTSMPRMGGGYLKKADGVLELTPGQPIADLDHVLSVGPDHQPQSDVGRTGALLEIAAPTITGGQAVNVTLGPDGYERTLAPDRREVAISTWLDGSFEGGQFRALVPITVELVGDEPVELTWRLETEMDPVSWELPFDPTITLSRAGGDQ